MKIVPVKLFQIMQFIPGINIFSFLLVFWNAFVTKSFFKKILYCYFIVFISYFISMILLTILGSIIPQLSNVIGLMCAYICPIIYTYGFIRFQERW